MSIEDTIRTIIREELERALGSKPVPQKEPKQVKIPAKDPMADDIQPVVTEPAKVETVAVEPATKEPINAVELLARVKEECGSDSSKIKLAKQILSSKFEFYKFADVPDEMVGEVWSTVKEAL